MKKTDFHVHTIYCDGKNTPEELIKTAIDKGFSAIGFSSHSFTPFDDMYCMSEENTDIYFNEVTNLKDKYKDKIEIFCGVEQDLFAPPPKYKYDYIIGSVHYLKFGDKYYPVDESAEITKDIANRFFGGDLVTLSEYYFEEVSKLPEITHADIIGHFDLITKFERTLSIPKDERYMRFAKNTMEKLIKSGAIIEVNTGAMARGFRDTPYPDDEILKFIKTHGGSVILSSDCHDAEKLGFEFENVSTLLLNLGFEEKDIKEYPNIIKS